MRHHLGQFGTQPLEYGRVPVDHRRVSVAVLPVVAAPAVHVLPTGVRRRPGRGAAVLALVLAGELLAGTGLRMAWEHRAALGDLLTAPAAPVPAGGALTTTSAVTTTWVVVPPAPVPTQAPPPPPPPRTEARNPFQAQAGG